MINYNIKREHIEGLILSCFLNQHRTLELDKMEFEAYKLPFELFKANNTHRMIAKAIYNLQNENKVVDEVLIHDYITSKTKLNEEEYLQVHTYTWCSFDTMLSYLKMLEDLDKEEKRMELLKGLR
jgi:hypothetical protein